MKVGDSVWWIAATDGPYGWPVLIPCKVLTAGERVAKVEFTHFETKARLARHVKVSELRAERPEWIEESAAG